MLPEENPSRVHRALNQENTGMPELLQFPPATTQLPPTICPVTICSAIFSIYGMYSALPALLVFQFHRGLKGLTPFYGLPSREAILSFLLSNSKHPHNSNFLFTCQGQCKDNSLPVRSMSRRESNTFSCWLVAISYLCCLPWGADFEMSSR